MNAEEKLQKIQELVDLQAKDEGLWCPASTISEAHIQQELRRLHAAVEAHSPIFIDTLIKNLKEK